MVRSRDVVQAEGSARTEGARRATGVRADGAAAGAGSLAPGQRWSASRKRDVVLRLLRGESLEALSREAGVEIYRLDAWRERAMAGLELGLKDRHGGCLRRRSPCHARDADQLRSHVELVRCHYNFVRPHRALRFGRETRTPAMQARLVSRRLALSDIFTGRLVRLRVFVAVVETAAGGLPPLSWSYEQRAAA